MTQPPNTPQHYGPDGRSIPEWMGIQGPQQVQGARRAAHPYPPAQLPPTPDVAYDSGVAPMPPAKPPGRRVTVPLLLLIFAGTLLALVSCAVGAGSMASSVPAPTVTTTAPAPPAETVTEPAATAEVPPICKAALGSADLGF